jgi:hypothetical protein
MAHIERRLTFHSSTHDVFAGLVNIGARPEWRPDIKRAISSRMRHCPTLAEFGSANYSRCRWRNHKLWVQFTFVKLRRFLYDLSALKNEEGGSEQIHEGALF